METSLAMKLFLDFNHYRFQTSNIAAKRARGEFVRGFKPTADRLALFEEVIVWCRERGIDPRLWIYMLFRGRSWSFAPSLTKGSLMSENMIKKYNKLDDRDYLDGYRRHIDDDLERTDPNAWDPNRDINHSVEALKARYAEKRDHDRCIREIFARTLGYHPKSAVCRACPYGDVCAKQLVGYVDFDIMALRLGEITAEVAKAQAKQNAAP